MSERTKKDSRQKQSVQRTRPGAGKIRSRRYSTLIWGTLTALVLGAFAVAVYLSAVSGSGSGSAEEAYVGGDFHALAVDPVDAGKVIVGGHGGAAISKDGGQMWEQIEDLGGADPMGWVVNSEDPQTMYAGGHPGLFRSEDGGESWNMDNSGLPATDVHGLGMAPSSPDTLYASIVGEGLYRSSDAGESWRLVNEEVVVMGPIPVDPRNSDTLYVAGSGGEFLKSETGGENWERVGKIPGGMAMSISQNRQSPDTFCTAASGGVYKSVDAGKSWNPSAEGLPEVISVVSVSPENPDVVYAGALEGEQARLFRSEDGGESRSARNRPLQYRSRWGCEV